MWTLSISNTVYSIAVPTAAEPERARAGRDFAAVADLVIHKLGLHKGQIVTYFVRRPGETVGLWRAVSKIMHDDRQAWTKPPKPDEIRNLTIMNNNYQFLTRIL